MKTLYVYDEILKKQIKSLVTTEGTATVCLQSLTQQLFEIPRVLCPQNVVYSRLLFRS